MTDDGTVMVQTVSGPVPSDGLGLTLSHEHVFTDVRHVRWARSRDAGWNWDVALGPVAAPLLGLLRHDPYYAVQNCELNEPDVAVAELEAARAVGVQTLVDPTCEAIGRFPELLATVSERSGIQIVIGSGYYIEGSHPSALRYLTESQIADQILHELRDGVGTSGIRPGIIGEIGVSDDFTTEERKVLRGAAIAYREARVPLYVHLPGWHRYGDEVLDIIESQGGTCGGVVLCHMNPSGRDLQYQARLVRRGAWLGYDMIGMDFFYGPEQLQSPSDEENVRAIVGLIAEVGAGRLLLSSDVFLKIMLKRYGGNGYGYVPSQFAPRLRAAGVAAADVTRMLRDNPRRLFEEAG